LSPHNAWQAQNKLQALLLSVERSKGEYDALSIEKE
jgi:hypothetical protein